MNKKTDKPQTIVRWVRFTPPLDVEVCKDPQCSQGDGDIQVSKDGAIIIFMQAPGSTGWRFHDVTIHPMGKKTDRLNLKWMVSPRLVQILHEEASIKRTYSYTVSVERLDNGQPTGEFVYLDPQMVDLGGG